MRTARRSNDRGHADINEDRVQPGPRFPTHAHRDMAILSFALVGAIAHEDSTGTGAILRPGELQRISALRARHRR